MSDGELRKIFQNHLAVDCHWQAIESWSTGQGVPDVEYCFKGGYSGWIENKKTTATAVKFETIQPAWIERRVRMGGRVFVAIRRMQTAGPRTEACDELYLYHGRHVRAIVGSGVAAPGLSLFGRGGPSKWPWDRIRQLLTE